MVIRLRSRARDIVYWIAKLWWVFVIVLPLVSFALFLAIDHANANAIRSQRHSNALTQKKFEQAIQAIDRRFSLALRVSTYSINKSVCGWREFLVPTLTDKRIPEARRNQIAAFLETQVTVPEGFHCKTLAKRPPKAATP